MVLHSWNIHPRSYKTVHKLPLGILIDEIKKAHSNNLPKGTEILNLYLARVIDIEGTILFNTQVSQVLEVQI